MSDHEFQFLEWETYNPVASKPKAVTRVSVQGVAAF